MTKFQFEIPDEEWQRWKATVPRTKNLDERIRELLEADADGRVLEAPPESEAAEAGGAAGESGPAPFDVPGQGEVAEQRRQAVRAAVQHIQDEGRVPKDELVELGGEIAGDTYADNHSLWKNLLQPTLSGLEEIESEGASGYWRTT